MIVNIPETKTYSECMDLISMYLKDIASSRGALKQWCEQEDLNYNAIVKIKNKNMVYYLPNMVIKLLQKFGYRATISRQYLEDQESTEDLFIVIKTKDVKEPGNSPAQ